MKGLAVLFQRESKMDWLDRWAWMIISLVSGATVLLWRVFSQVARIDKLDQRLDNVELDLKEVKADMNRVEDRLCRKLDSIESKIDSFVLNVIRNRSDESK
jgi:hypothetical protein